MRVPTDAAIASAEIRQKSRALIYRHERDKFRRWHPELLYEIRRSTGSDPKIELDYLREKVCSLEDDIVEMFGELTEIKAQMQSFQQFISMTTTRQSTLNIGSLSCVRQPSVDYYFAMNMPMPHSPDDNDAYNNADESIQMNPATNNTVGKPAMPGKDMDNLKDAMNSFRGDS